MACTRDVSACTESKGMLLLSTKDEILKLEGQNALQQELPMGAAITGMAFSAWSWDCLPGGLR